MLWWKGNLCSVLAIFICITIILWYLKEYSELRLWINYWPVFFKFGTTAFTHNFWAVFTYYITQLCFSWKYPIITSTLHNFWPNVLFYHDKWVSVYYTMIFRPMTEYNIIILISWVTYFERQERHVIVSLIFNLKWWDR